MSGQLEFLVCLRAGQFGQSVKPKVNISHCLRQPNVCPWLWLRLRVRPSRGLRTILGPFLGQRPRSSSANTELSSESAALRTLGGHWQYWHPASGQVWSVITSSDGELKWSLDKIKDKIIQNKYQKDPANEVIWIQWREINGRKNVCENNISSINCLDFPRWATMRFLLNRYFCCYTGF